MIQHQQSLVQSEGHLGKNSMLNLALNPSNLGNGSENWLVFINIWSTGLPKYLLQLIPTNNHSYTLRRNLLISHIITAEMIHSRIHFFPNVLNEWNKLDDKIKGATLFSLFKASLLKMSHCHAHSTNRIHNPVGIRLLMCFCLVVSHLSEHKF